MNDFNPYEQWLGIPETSRPNHYRLLGLRLFEDLPATISAAAGRLTQIVAGHLYGPHGHLAQQLLAEIESARACLLNPGKKSQYDAQLRQQLASSPPNPVAPGHGAAYGGTPVPPTPAGPADVKWKPAGGGAPLPPSAAVPPSNQWSGTQPVPPSSAPRMAASPSSPAAPMPPTAGGSSTFQGVKAPSDFANADEPPPPLPPTCAPASPVHYPPAASPSAFGAAPAMPPPSGYASPPAMAIPVGGAPAYAVPVPAPMAIPQAAPLAPSMASPMYSAAVPQAAPSAAPVAAASAPVTSPAVAPPAEESPHVVAPKLQLDGARRGLPSPGMALGVATAVLVIIAVLVLFSNKGRQVARGTGTPVSPGQPTELPAPPSPPQQPAQPPVQAAATTPTPRPTPPQPQTPVSPPPARPSQPEPRDVPKPMPQPEQVATNMPKPVAPPVPMPPAGMSDPKADEDVTRALNAARAALSANEVAVARAQVGTARKAGVEARAEEINRVEALITYWEQFWKAVREGIKGLEVGGQLAVNDTFVGVVEVQSEAIILRVQGQNRTYAIKTLPRDLALALALSWLNKGEASTSIALGTYHAMHPKGDRQMARQLWQAAAAAGARDVAQMLLPELDVPLPTELPAMAEADAKPGADGRFPIPGATAQNEARAEVKTMFEADYASATTPAAKLELAAKMMARAEEPSTAVAMRYMLLGEAGKLAAQAGDYSAMSAALDQLAEHFAADAATLKADYLFDAAKTAEGQDAHKALASAALQLCDEAVLLDNVDAALKLARTALASARKSGDSELLKQSSAREREVRDLK